MNEPIVTYLDAIRELCPRITKAEMNYIQDGLSVTQLEAKHLYIHAGTVQNEIGFVFSGLLRAFYIDHKGREITVNFIREGGYATHYSSFLAQTFCKYYFQCIEPSVLVNLSYIHIQEGYNRFPGIERYGRLIAEQVLKAQQKRLESFLFDTAEERYLAFVRENPNTFNRVSLTHLASYLGIERQSLTRIRNKLVRR